MKWKRSKGRKGRDVIDIRGAEQPSGGSSSGGLGGLPIPDAFVNWVIRNYDPTPRLASRLPVLVEIGEVAIRPEAVQIRPAKGSR